jgi:signal peptidase II
MTLARRILIAGGLCALAFAADQISKWLILSHVMVPPRVIPLLPFLNLTLGFNTGVSFGIGRDFFDEWPLALTAFKVVVASGLLVWAVKTEDGLERCGLALIAGGALGNALDRWRIGAVADFIDVHWAGWHFHTFNVADSAITLGVGLILLAALTSLKAKPASGS